MKKTVLFIALAFGVSNAFAQTLSNPKGEPYLPETGDYAISMDVNPLFHWVGNFFNQYGNNDAPGVGFLNSDQTIIVKKFTSPTDAMRGVVRLGFTSQTDKNNVTDISATTTFPTVTPVVEDKRKISETHIAIGVGKEMRRGKTRLQGFYGADAMLWFAGMKSKYEYGNTMSATTDATHSTTPLSTDWSMPNGDGTFASSQVGSRTLESKSGATIGFGVRGFLGVEYFLWPKISVGAEFGWGLGVQVRGKGKKTTETTGTNAGGTVVVAEQETETAGASRFGFDTDINQSNGVFGLFGADGSNTGSASLRATFHF